MPLTLVANQNIRVPPSRFIRSLRVPAGFDVADNEIVRLCSAEDLVITADIPLAAEVLEKGAAALNPRGERYSPSTIREKLTMRDFSDTFLGAYLDVCGDVLLGSVGGYHIEGRGAQLFSRMDGDQFTIRGLPLLPVLDYLRTRSVMPI